MVSESDQADTSLDVSSLALCEPGPYYRERAFLPREFSQVTTAGHRDAAKAEDKAAA